MAAPTKPRTDGNDGAGGDDSAAKPDLEKIPIDDAFDKLKSSSDGLSSRDAAARLETYGPNALEENKQSVVLQFLKKFWDPISWMIEVALILTIVLGDYKDTVVIGVLLLLNGCIGFWEEHQASNAIDALKSKLASQANAKRDGKWGSVPAPDLVPGDVIRVRLGDVVPADARILSDAELELDQSALTGESLPAKRKQGEAAYSGSVVTKGEADCLVIGTGTNTFFGRTAQLVASAGGESLFQKAVLKIGRYLIIIAVAFVIAVLVVGILRGDAIDDMIEFALVLVIAGVPIALPAVLSVTMAVGAGGLAKKNAVVSHLPVVEDVGGVDVLCSDKTGTLTQNKLTVGDPKLVGDAGKAHDADEIILDAALASRAEDRDPIDLAVLAAVDDKSRLDGYDVLAFTPFDPVKKRTVAKVSKNGKTFSVTKGAPQVIADLAPKGDPARDQVGGIVDDLANRGIRALGVARTAHGDGDDDGQWQVLGVLPLSDPPREDSKETIQTAQSLGVEVKMVTGDNLAIAKETAEEVGLDTQILDASILDDDSVSDDDLASRIEGANGFAQVFPEHKYKIVESLQKHHHIVGMTGDGVNDAPALKQADAGIAVSGATEAARAAADIVLLAPGLSVIVDAIKSSREIFERMMSYTLYRIAETIALVLFISIVMLGTNFKPVTAIMILLLAILNDGTILTIAYDHAPSSGRPQAWQMPLILTVSTSIGLFNVLESLAIFFVASEFLDGTSLALSDAVLPTLMYLQLSVSGHLTIFVTRLHGPFYSKPAPAPILLGAVAGAQALATCIAGFGWFMEPLPWEWAGIVWAYCLLCFVLQDFVKLGAYRVADRERSAPVEPAPAPA